MKFLLIEPFFGGSHRDFAQGLMAHSRHQIDLIRLPARFWKWRMRGAALYLYKKIKGIDQYDGLVTTDLMSLSDLKMLLGADCPPALVYFHENQLTYPLAPGEQRDVQFGFTDITTALAADRILFNSHTHFQQFFDALPAFIKMMPEFLPLWLIPEIQKKSAVLYPGCELKQRPVPPLDLQPKPPLIIWNHRWEFDKNPQLFFNTLGKIADRGIDFRLALLGENFQVVPKPFVQAKKRFESQLVQYGYVDSKTEYRKWLDRGAVVISTADQENFGISIVEAIHYGCVPLLPNRLSYPEIIPEPSHHQVLYETTIELEEKLGRMLSRRKEYDPVVVNLQQHVQQYAWSELIEAYDIELAAMAQPADS